MRRLLVSATSAAFFIVAIDTPSWADVKAVPYTAVKVQVAEASEPDAALKQMRKTFVEAVSKKDSQRLFALVGPTFVWSSQGTPRDTFDHGRDALHNFKVAFGFREPGKDADGGVADGPYWDLLAAFASDKGFFEAASGLVCGPIAATVVDEGSFERSKGAIGADDSVDWFFTLADTPATSTPAGGSVVGQVKQVALPVIDAHPPAQGESAPPVTYLKVLLPSGKSGWIPASSAIPLVTDRLCYGLTAKGERRISAFDQVE